jgi:hypothetical protein
MVKSGLSTISTFLLPLLLHPANPAKAINPQAIILLLFLSIIRSQL